nr:RNA-directed DNA polymerase, eukaryota [Tanacetum cinerariifolium]
MNVVKGNNLPPVISTSLALVLDESCIVSRNLDFFVLGETKNPSSITNLYILLSNEGFHNVKLSYLRGLWVMIEMESLFSKEKILKHEGVASWFNNLGNAQEDFVSKERIVWVDMEGVPTNAWTLGTFKEIGSKWGKVIEIEEYNDGLFARKRICIKTRQEDNVDQNMENLDKDNSYNHPHSVNVPSPDPFNIHELLRKNAVGVQNISSKSISFPPGFSPVDNISIGNEQDAEVSRSDFNHVCNNEHMSSK